MRRLVWCAIAALFVLTLVPARVIAQPVAQADLVALKALVARYVEVREARDATGLAGLFVDDADQLVSTGEWRRGRDAVVSGGLASSARSSGVRTIEVETVRIVSPGVAIVDGRYGIAATPTSPARQMWTTFVMVRRPDGWRISAIRNMRPTE